MDSCTENISIQLDNGVDVLIEATLLGGEEEVDFDFLPFEQVTRAVEAIACSMATTITGLDLEQLNAAIDTLKRQDVIDVKDGNYCIIVELFRRWVINSQ